MEMEVNHAPSTGKTGKVKMSFFQRPYEMIASM